MAESQVIFFSRSNNDERYNAAQKPALPAF
jgi:hypothetical protein